MHKEFVIIGAGPAGLTAAIEAAKRGVKPLVIDENDRAGGQLFLQTHKFFGSRHHNAGIRGFQIAEDLLTQARDLKIEILLGAAVYGVFPDLRVAYSKDDDRGDGSVKADTILFATGALEKGLFFKGWTKPGVMSAGAAQNMMHVNYVLPGKKVLVVGSGNVGLILAYQLHQAGSSVVGLIEMMDCVKGYQVHAGKIRRLGIPIMTSCTIKEVLGKDSVERAVLISVDAAGKEAVGTEITIECDLICLSVGLQPFNELCWATREIEMTYAEELGGFMPLHSEDMETTLKNVFVAGDVAGVEEANTAMEEGRLAGIAVAERLGKIDKPSAERQKKEILSRLNHLRMGAFGEGRLLAKERIIALRSVKNEQSGRAPL